MSNETLTTTSQSTLTLTYGVYGTHKHKVIYIKDSQETDPFVNKYIFPNQLMDFIEKSLGEGYELIFKTK